MSPPLIQLQELHKSYGEGQAKNHVLRGLSLQISEGEMVAIMGASGSGKSTLLNIIGGLDQDYTGQATVDGVAINSLNDRELSHFRNRQVGFIFQQFHLLPHRDVLANVCLPTLFDRGERRTKKDIEAQGLQVLERVGIGHKAAESPNHLSGGERQRVAIARALMARPKILLCDEPTGALDSKTSETVFQLIADLNHQEGMTILIVTHERELAARCPRIVTIVDGTVASDKRPNEGEAIS